MDETMLGIGQMAQRSGLTVSAPRFYAGASVLAPDVVDPRSASLQQNMDSRQAHYPLQRRHFRAAQASVAPADVKTPG